MSEANCQTHGNNARYSPFPKWGVCVYFVSIHVANYGNNNDNGSLITARALTRLHFPVDV